MEILTILTSKLNKYLIQIINDYVIIDHEKLIKEELKERKALDWFINKDLTIEDIIVKCFQRGYKGFYIQNTLTFVINYIDSICNYLIHSNIHEHKKYYSFEDDKRDLYSMPIDSLDDVITKRIEIYNN